MQWALDHRNQTRPRVTQERDEKPMSTTHKALAAWVEEVAALTTPDKIHWVTGAPEEIDGQLCLSSPYVEGQTLREELQGQALAWERASRIAADLAHAWGAAHQQGISLTGLSPDSVIVTPDGHALLSELALLPLPRPLVQVGSRMVAGAPAYLAPEVARGEPPTPASGRPGRTRWPASPARRAP